MKNILKYLLSFSILFAIFSCAEDEMPNPVYNGDSFLFFDKGVEDTQSVVEGSVQKDVTISYGVVKAVAGNHSVRLVLDPSSTAVEGVHFQIIKGTDELTAGETNGEFIVRILEDDLTPTPKTALFKLESSTLKNATFDQNYQLNMQIQCGMNWFLGGGIFRNVGFWVDGVVPFQDVLFEVDNITAPTKIYARDFFEPGIDLVLNYNNATQTVTVQDQFTGWIYNYQGTPRQVWVRQLANSTNTVDFCGRKMKLSTQYYLQGTNLVFSGDTSENFTGQ